VEFPQGASRVVSTSAHVLLYAIHLSSGGADTSRLADAVATAAAPFQQLDPSTLAVERSSSGRLAVATLGHAPERVAPRRHVARSADLLTAFDGLPVAAHASFPPWDASRLGEHWDEALDHLEGQFSAVQVDLAADRFECLTDPLGLHPLYAQRLADGWLVANSVTAIREVSAASRPDAVGVSTFLTLGWASANRTLLDEVSALPAGSRLSFDANGMNRRVGLDPRALLAAEREGGSDNASAIDELVALTRAATVTSELPVKCAVTGGRDTRVVLALCLAAGAKPTTATMGTEQDLDVQIGREIAAYAGLPHEVQVASETSLFEDAARITATFVSLTDGLSSLLQLPDIGDLYDPPGRVGVQAWGVAGEIGRCGTGQITPLAANAPLIRGSTEFQKRMLVEKVRDGAGILTPDAMATARSQVERFVDERASEGWAAADTGELFYTFDRVSRWGSAAVRRATAIDDLFTPFATRPFIRWAYSMSNQERYAEATHYRILSRLDPQLRDFRYELPWRTLRPGTAPLHAALGLGRIAASRVPLPRVRSPREPEPAAARPFVFQWLERHRELHREVCLSARDSELWNWLDRARLEQVLTRESFDDATAEGLLRAITLAWYFHAPASP
jgi:asparagine synthase (glutamine-hydrolysing)